MSAIPLSETTAKRRIGDILLDHGLVTAEELAEATLEQERTQQPLGQILVGRGSITRLELASALAEQWSDPAASITSGARSAPRPAQPPSAKDEAQYAARLQEAVADLARKVQSNKPLEGIDERVDELSRRIEGTLARTQHIEAAVATLAESLEGVTTGVEEAFNALQLGTGELVSDLARIEQTVGEIATREAPHADGPSLADIEGLRDHVDGIATRIESLADTGSAVRDVTARVEQVAVQLEELRATTSLDELQSTVRDLESRSRAFADVTERLDRVEAESAGDQLRGDLESQARLLDDLRTDVGELRARPAGTPELEGRLEVLEARIDESIVGGTELTTRIDAMASVRPEEASAERLNAFETQLDGLARAQDETLANAIEGLRNEREPDGELSARLDALEARAAEGFVTPAALEARIESLSRTPTEDGLLVRRLDELETSRVGDLDTINVLAVAMDRIRHDLTTTQAPVETETSEALEAVAALAERLSALENAPAVEPVASHDDSELVLELERFRLILERIGLHLGEHDRAIADLAPGRGVEERLQELTVLVHDLAESQQNASAPQAAGAASPIPGDLGSLLQRVEEGESASHADNEKLMNRLERMATSIDWRLQRLEADETDETADAE